MKKFFFSLLAVFMVSCGIANLFASTNVDNIEVERENQAVMEQMRRMITRGYTDVNSLECMQYGCNAVSDPVVYTQPGYTNKEIKNPLFGNTSKCIVTSNWYEDHCIFIAGTNPAHGDGWGDLTVTREFPKGAITFAYTHAGGYYYIVN